MLESSFAYPTPNYSHIVPALEGSISLAPQLSYITDIVLELEVEFAKIKVEMKEIKKQLSINHLFFNQQDKT